MGTMLSGLIKSPPPKMRSLETPRSASKSDCSASITAEYSSSFVNMNEYRRQPPQQTLLPMQALGEGALEGGRRNEHKTAESCSPSSQEREFMRIFTPAKRQRWSFNRRSDSHSFFHIPSSRKPFFIGLPPSKLVDILAFTISDLVNMPLPSLWRT